MSRKSAVLVLVLMGFLILLFPNLSASQTISSPIGTEFQGSCPGYGYITDTQGNTLDVDVTKICDPVGLSYENLRKYDRINVSWENLPYQGQYLGGGKTVEIVSITLNVTARGCKSCGGGCTLKDNNMEVYVWNNNLPTSNKWYKINPNTIPVRLKNDYIFDVTSDINPRQGEYYVKIINHGSTDGNCLNIFYIGLGVVYYEMGDAKTLNYVYTSQNTVPKYSVFPVTGQVDCIGGYCGHVNAYLQYSDDGMTYYNISESSSATPMYIVNQNPYDCGVMEHGVISTCRPQWYVYGTEGVQGYRIRMFSDSDTILDNQSNYISMSIVPGNLRIINAGIEKSDVSIYGDDSTNLYGTVRCLDAPCRVVEFYAKYRKSGENIFETIGSSGNLTTDSNNPYNCSYMNTSYPYTYCSRQWNIKGQVPGSYEITLFTNSSDEDVYEESLVNPILLTVNSEQNVGILSISTSVNPNIINASENTVLSGYVMCSNEDCGDVWVYASHDKDGLGIQGQNPKFCGSIDEDDSYNVWWNVTGNEADNYNIILEAYSKTTSSQNITSTAPLTVNPNVSNFDINSFWFEQGSIYKGDFATLNSIITCPDYCGKIGTVIYYNQSGLSTLSENPQYCIPSSAFPCSLTWNISGDRVGSYTINIEVLSNESDRIDSDSDSLVVQDIENPQPILSVEGMDPLLTSYELGTPITVKGYLKCQGGDCGNVDVFLKYSEVSGSWYDIVSSTPLFTNEPNPKTITMIDGEARDVEWTVNSNYIGIYDIGIIADASDQNVLDPQSITSQSIEITESVDVAIDVQSPGSLDEFARGDEITLKISVTKDGYPLIGASVTASAEPVFLSEPFNEIGNGVYSKDVNVGGGVPKGSYGVTFYVNDGSHIYTETSSVDINPELDVSLDTDKETYEILEAVNLDVHVTKKGQSTEADVQLKLVCDSETEFSDNFHVDYGYYSYRYVVSKYTPPGVCKFELNTTDEYGNYNFTYKEIVIFPSAKEVYKVDFISPESQTKYKKGDSAKIRTKVTYGGDPLETANVTCRDPFNHWSIQLSHVEDGTYYGEYSIPKDAPLDYWILKCGAEENDLFGSDSVGVEITPLELKIEVVSPTQTILEVGETARISLKLKYPDNSPLEGATVYIKRGNEIIYLNETSPGIYEGEYEVKDQGVYNFDVYAEDQFGNAGSFPGEIILTAGFSPLNLYWFILPFILAVAALAGVVWKRGRKEVIIKEEPSKPKIDKRSELQNRIKETERKIRDIEKAKDEVEKEYYERKIDEKTFNRMIQNYEQDRIRLNVDLESLKKELQGLPG